MLEKFDWRRALVLCVLLAAIIMLPQICRAQTTVKTTEAKMDTITLDYSQIQNIFQKASSTGKSVKYYVVYTYKGEQDITTTGKSVLDYIEICKEAKISPRLALKVKDGQVVSIIKAKTKMRL